MGSTTTGTAGSTARTTDHEPEHLDVVVVGAGLSGVGAAATLLRRHPDLDLAVLESREVIGGTWDLFRYPGVRSDSDMYTLGYAARPWAGEKALADGDDIRTYVQETAAETGVAQRVRYRQRVVSASWRSEDSRWVLTVLHRTPGEGGAGAEWREGEDGATSTITCSFLLACTGYYRYDEGHRPEIPGLEDFAGDVVHPQHWPAALDVEGRRVVVVGSGATAVTLVPALARRGAQVTMLQRSPTYVAAVPSRDRLAMRLRGRVPEPVAQKAVRAKHIAGSMLLYQYARRRPAAMRALLERSAAEKLPEGYDVATHFRPRYEPWDQRLCAAPGGDLFRAISSGAAEVVTDAIERVDAGGVRLASGARVDADVLVTATGLSVLVLGGMRLDVDGRPVEPGGRLAWKGMMLEGLPNLAYTIGYVNSSWTLRADLVAGAVADLLGTMRRRGAGAVVAQAPAGTEGSRPVIDLAAGYVRRGLAQLPRQSERAPWRVHQNYLLDLVSLRLDRRGRDLRFLPAGTRPDGSPAVGAPPEVVPAA
ncbi:NAD(P)/FAD-dependent oxidoreductase [uncultured Pseudokineococcus sp.]|uniref:flavin-containing monooxygenase n=1 Tax=uncultured Pseudokineococcus sp. TaxID=1642928 RepID=UPI0026020D8D|nr:NAD(P)/FAD-dependent oxidoreductase [uncultured Pseudokineococcus sp.]